MHQIARPSARANFPKPTKIISKSALQQAWINSRDVTGRPGRPGVDNVTALQFAAKLDSNLSNIARSLKAGKFGFSKLRAVFIPKPNSDKERMICIPTVQDRLVQRVIVQYLNSKRFFPIYNSSSFGFIAGRGTRDAIHSVVRLRAQYPWCLKTDIEAFFDRVPRQYLKRRVMDCLKVHSLTPIIHKVIDCEAKSVPANRIKLERQGIRCGCGIRQGMPLSPLLANLALSEFDSEIESHKIKMVRYADDLVLFFHDKDAARNGLQLVKELLEKIELTIPEISSTSKTRIVHASDPLIFLGREIVYLGSEKSYVARVGSAQIRKIKDKLSSDFSFRKRSKEGHDFQMTLLDLGKSVSAYLGIYQDAYDYEQFASEIRGHVRKIVHQLFVDIFGQESLRSLTPEARKFLGVHCLDWVEPNSELDV